MVEMPHKRHDGTYEQTLGENWTAEYAEEPATGLWSAALYQHDVVEWRSHGYASLRDARQAVEEYYDQV